MALIPEIEILTDEEYQSEKRKTRLRQHRKKESDDEYIPGRKTTKTRKQSQARQQSRNDAVKEEPEECKPSQRATSRKKQDNASASDDKTSNGVKPKRVHGKTWLCKKCPMVFPKVRLLREHRKIHHAPEEDIPKHSYSYDDIQEIYRCNTCDAECGTQEEMDKHIKTHEEQFKCLECNEVFQKAYNYATHMYEHSEDKIFRCPLCQYTTVRRTCLLTHVNRMHLQKFPYRCEVCGKGFTDIVLHREHSNEHLGLKPFVCVVCNKGFPFSRYLLTHQIRSHRVSIDGEIMPNQCGVCLRIFGKVSTMEKHYIARHERTGPHEKRHLCDICGKGFAAKDKLKVHYRVHTGIKPYTCSYCAKSFTKKDYLVMHERVHSGEKPYSCEYCGKCFNQGAPLRIHVRSHTGERPYVCHICQTGYISKGALNLHFKTCPGTAIYDD